MAVWFVLSDKGILADMSEKPNITKVADTFFHLWQRQVSLMAQSPDKALEQLVRSGEKIAVPIKKSGDIKEDETDTSDSP